MIKKLQIETATKIEGWMSEAELLFLAECASKSNVIFEIGSFKGRSARAMADNTEGKLYCIDPWNVENYNQLGIAFVSTEVTFSLFYANLYKHIKSGRVTPIRKYWADYEPPEKADFIFIDGDHRYNAVVADIEKALKYLTPGGILAGHDFEPQWPDVIKAVEEKFPKFELTDTIWSVHA